MFPLQQFPITHFDEFACQWVPRWPNHEPIILAAYEALIEKIGPCTVVGHSQGAGFAAEIARRKPHIIRQVVAIEPGGMPNTISEVPLPRHLVVWGDHIEPSGSHWTGYRRQADNYFSAIQNHTETVVIDLPEKGILGNSHFPMMDVNSDEIFELVKDWLQR